MNRVSDFGHSIFILTCYYSVIYVFGIPFVYSLAKKKHKTMKKKVISLFMVIALSMTAGAQTQVKEHRRSISDLKVNCGKAFHTFLIDNCQLTINPTDN